MQTLAKAALGIALVAVLATLTHERISDESAAPPSESSAHGPARKYALVPCPRGQLPDNGVCVPVPNDRAAFDSPPGKNGVSHLVAKLPARPTDMQRYASGLPLLTGEASEALLPTAAQVGPAGRGWAFRFATRASAPVSSALLEGQRGSTRVGPVDSSNGRLVTTHTVDTPAGVRRYALYYANLSSIQVTSDQELSSPTPLAASPSNTSEDQFLYLDVRRVRRGLTDDGWTFTDYLDDSKAVRVDPRNVFPLQ